MKSIVKNKLAKSMLRQPFLSLKRRIMRIIINLTIIFLFVTYPSFSQPAFFRSFNIISGANLKMASTKDGGVVIANSTQIVSTLGIEFTRFNNIGDTLWRGIYELPYTKLSAVKQTIDGGFIATGSLLNLSEEIFLIKIDSTGNLSWFKTYGGSQSDISYSVKQTLDDGYIIVGETKSYLTNNFINAYIIKTDSLGNTQWSKTVGGSYISRAYEVEQFSDGNYFVFGETYILNNGGSTPNLYLIKMDSTGSVLWTKTYGGAVTLPAGSFLRTIDNNLILGSEYDGIIKVDTSGNILWEKDYQFTGYIIKECIDSGFVFVTTTGNQSDIILTKTNSIGNVKWCRKYTIGLGNFFPNQSLLADPTTNGSILISRITATQPFGAVNMIFFTTDSLGHGGCNEALFSNFAILRNTSDSLFTSNISSPVTITSTMMVNHKRGNKVISTTCPIITNFIETKLDSEIQVHPNPNNGTFKLLTSDNIRTPSRIIITNSLMQTIYERTIQPSSHQEINLDEKNGLYFLQLVNEHKVHTKKIIIDK
jgi:Secretion system C-terminal sorting domain